MTYQDICFPLVKTNPSLIYKLISLIKPPTIKKNIHEPTAVAHHTAGTQAQLSYSKERIAVYHQ
jgi:hypothetical protein